MEFGRQLLQAQAHAPATATVFLLPFNFTHQEDCRSHVLLLLHQSTNSSGTTLLSAIVKEGPAEISFSAGASVASTCQAGPKASAAPHKISVKPNPIPPARVRKMAAAKAPQHL